MKISFGFIQATIVFNEDGRRNRSSMWHVSKVSYTMANWRCISDIYLYNLTKDTKKRQAMKLRE